MTSPSDTPPTSDESEQKSGRHGDQTSPGVRAPVASGSLPNTLADPWTIVASADPANYRRTATHIPSEEKITTPVIDVELTAAQQLRAGVCYVDLWDIIAKAIQGALDAPSAHEPHPANPTEQELHTEIERLQRANAELLRRNIVLSSAHEPPAAPMKMHVDYEWQRQRLESSGPAEECAAGGPSKPATTGCIWDDCDQEAIYCAGHAREFAAPAPPPKPVRGKFGVMRICAAYESGFGHGAAGDGLPNPYAKGSTEFEAYQIGVDAGYAEGKRGAAQPPSDDARDAARYRWIREHADDPAADPDIQDMWRKVTQAGWRMPTAAEWDAAIDAAITRATSTKPAAPECPECGEDCLGLGEESAR